MVLPTFDGLTRWFFAFRLGGGVRGTLLVVPHVKRGLVWVGACILDGMRSETRLCSAPIEWAQVAEFAKSLGFQDLTLTRSRKQAPAKTRPNFVAETYDEASRLV